MESVYFCFKSFLCKSHASFLEQVILVEVGGCGREGDCTGAPVCGWVLGVRNAEEYGVKAKIIQK